MAATRRRWGRRLLVAGIAVAIAGALAAAVLPALMPWAGRPNVVVVVADTLRADRLGAYGSTRGLTPVLDGLAARSVVFRNAYAGSSWTSPSVASLFTSTLPSHHQVRGYESRLRADEVTFAERLTDAGYVGGAVVANCRLTMDLGWNQGFRYWYAYGTLRKPRGDRVALRALRRAASMRSWIRNPLRRPVLLYVHFMDPHGPYLARRVERRRFGLGDVDPRRVAAVNERLLDEGRWGELGDDDVRLLERLYDGEVRALDAYVGRLLKGLARQGMLDDTVLVFTADHGEEFREHGGLGHGRTLFNDQLRVPLVIARPGAGGGRVVAENVSTLDVAPTLLDVAGLAPEPRFRGRPLTPLLEGREPERDVAAELLLAPTPGDWRQHALALVRGTDKLLVPRAQDGTALPPEVYALATDPGEQHPNPPDLATVRPALVSAAETLAAELRRTSGSAEYGTVDEKMRERLRALGYAR